jgi:hypothetical protein
MDYSEFYTNVYDVYLWYITYSQCQFKNFDKIKNQEDGSIIRIQRPQTWSKPWSVSQKELKSLLESYFDSTRNSNSADCFNYIMSTKKEALLSDEFAITRTVPE